MGADAEGEAHEHEDESRRGEGEALVKLHVVGGDELALALDATALVKRLNLLLCAGQLSASTQTVIVNALLGVTVNANSSATLKRQRVCAAVLMVMACPEYLIQK